MTNFVVITFRRLLKEKYYALICVLSLALGIASALLITLYLLSELTFDQYHENHNNINRVVTRIADVQIAVSGDGVGPALVQENPQFLDFVRFREAPEQRFTVGTNSNTWEEVHFVDPSVFEHFTIAPIYGNPASALTDPYSLAISKSFAEFYFGTGNPVGERISTTRFDFQITLVYEDLPNNVTQKFEVLMPYSMQEVYEPETAESAARDFFPTGARTFLITASPVASEVMAEISNGFRETHMNDAFGLRPDMFEISLQVLSEIHFGAGITLDDEATGNIVNIYLFSAIAIVLVLVSCINYVNLATARAASRIREVAMKKILGAGERRLIIQFLIESLMFVIIAIGIGMLLAAAALVIPSIQVFTGFTGLSELFSTSATSLWFLGVVILLSLLSGIYPAYYLSRQNILSAFRAESKSWRSGLPVRQVLVFAQMVTSVMIVSCVFIMLKQAEFLSDSPLGFTRDNRLVVELQGADAIRARQALATELENHSNIESVSMMARTFGRGLSIGVQQVTNGAGEEITLTSNNFRIGSELLETLEIDVLGGIPLQESQDDSDTRPVLVNETLAKFMGWEQAIGQEFGNNRVVGMIRDFHYMSLHQPIDNLSLTLYDDAVLDDLPESQKASTTIDLIVAIRSGFDNETRNFIEDTVRQFSSQTVIEILTLDEVWYEMYEDDTQAVDLVVFFSGISVFISLLGLTGLSAFNTQQRSKEVAIRKVIGAPVMSLLVTLSLNMLKMIALSIIPAFFIAYYASNIWLERFAYQAEFSLAPYAIAAVIVIACSIVTLLLQTYRTAQSNPVNYLKYE